MLKRFSLNHLLFSMVADVAAVLVALAVAAHLRTALPWGPALAGATAPWPLYPMLVGLWLVVAFVVSLYDPRRAYKVVDEFQTLALALSVTTDFDTPWAAWRTRL